VTETNSVSGICFIQENHCNRWCQTD